MNIHERAKECYENNGTILPVLESIKTKVEFEELKLSVKGKHKPFFKTARVELKEFLPALRNNIRFQSRVDIIDDMICTDHILRNGPLTKLRFHDLTRAIATGGMRELPVKWTGLVSINAMVNAEKNIEAAFRRNNRTRLSHATYLKATPRHGVLNSNEHFYNNQFSAAIVLCYKLYFDDDRETLENICDVSRQVHITTQKENNILKHNGQNAEDRIGWKEAYALNDIVLMDAHARPVVVQRLRDVVPDGLIETAMDMREGWKD